MLDKISTGPLIYYKPKNFKAQQKSHGKPTFREDKK